MYIGKIKSLSVVKFSWLFPYLSDFHAAVTDLVELIYLNSLLVDTTSLL